MCGESNPPSSHRSYPQGGDGLAWQVIWLCAARNADGQAAMALGGSTQRPGVQHAVDRPHLLPSAGLTCLPPSAGLTSLPLSAGRTSILCCLTSLHSSGGLASLSPSAGLISLIWWSDRSPPLCWYDALGSTWPYTNTCLRSHAHLHPQFAVFALLNTIVSSDGPPPMPAADSMPPPLHSLLSLCFQRDTSIRPTTSELKQHPWIVESTSVSK